ncbi:MAG: FG-GAP-like repeat-containing protein [Crocinitomicaceae bacterium]|nr:FG-GAP-like repeat-containing protein [Crocinitomicaceae bacterium]
MNKIYTLLLAGLSFNAFAQNTCATALPITAGLHTISAVDGTEVPALICAANGTGATAGEWYTYTPTADYTLTVTTDLPVNTGRDTRFHVYTGSCGAFSCHAGDDDGGSGFLSVASFQVEQGTTYYIAFDNRWDSNGFDFELTETPPVTPPVPGLTFTPEFIPTMGGAYKLAVADMNGDFLDDIVTVSEGEIQIHYQEATGGFTPVTIATDLADFLPTWSIAIADYDKNGFSDILYGGGSGVTFMRANATGTAFEEVSGNEYVFSQRSNFIDINNDGHLDAFVCHDVQPNVFYINDGFGNLSHNQGGMGDHPNGGNYGSIWVDYDNDGDPDLFIAKCRGGQTTAKINELHRNDGNGVFTDVSIGSNMADSVQTWSSAWNDYDNDGLMDALVGASSTADGTHKFMRNLGDGTFEDITAGSGWDLNESLSIEHISFDFDNDGYADVMGGGNKIMFNNGDLTFGPSVYPFGVGAVGDLNDDGFLDVQSGSTIYFNDGNDNNWIKVNLQGIQSNSQGIGARVELYGPWGKQIRDVQSGIGFRHMSTMNVHFGIGEATEIDSVLVKWPSGIIDVIQTPAINESIIMVEGTNQLSLLEEDGKSVILFPNPTTEVLYAENLDVLNMTRICVVSQLGQVVMEGATNTNEFDVAHLEEGLYFFIVETTDGKKYGQSFVKK